MDNTMRMLYSPNYNKQDRLIGGKVLNTTYLETKKSNQSILSQRIRLGYKTDIV